MDGDSNVVGLSVCFSCGRAVPDEEPILVVLRRHQKLLPRGELELSSGVMPDVSLQICLPCAGRAAKRELSLQFDPMGVIPLEMDAFYWYVSKAWHRSFHRPNSAATLSDFPESSNHRFRLMNNLSVDTVPEPTNPLCAPNYQLDTCWPCGKRIDLTRPYLHIEVAMSNIVGGKTCYANGEGVANFCQGCWGLDGPSA